MKNKGILFLLICSLAYPACVESIDLSQASARRFVVIQGQISNQPGAYQVTVRRSATNQEPEEDIFGAKVSIHTGSGQIASLSEVSPGIYETDSTEITGRIGESYQLKVVLPEGSHYQSRVEKMPPSRPVGEISYEFVREEVLNELSNIVEEKKIRVAVTNPVPADLENLYYKWEVRGEYEFRETAALSDIFATTGAGPLMFTCFLHEPLKFGDIYLLDGTGLKGTQQFTQEIKTIPVNYKFTFNYCVHVDQLSLTKGAFEFWEQVKKTSERNGLFQESAPGTVKGNIENLNDPEEIVFGYFYTASVSSERMFVSPDSVGNPFSPCFLIDPVFEEACDECLELAGSFRGAPDYWPDE